MRPMLAKPLKPEWIKPPFYLQPKLDGMRAIWDGYNFLSRTGKLITSVPTILAQLHRDFPSQPLDGELYIHGVKLQRIISSVRRTVDIDEDPRVGYWVYDLPQANMTFRERWLALETLSFRERIHLVHCQEIDTYNPAENLNVYVASGYEGTILRNASGLYKFGKRSSDLLKIKDFLEEEFVIQGTYQSMTHEKVIVPEGTPGSKEYADGTWYKDGIATPVDSLGGFICLTPEGEAFEVGSGFSDEERRYFWHHPPPIGELCTVQFQEYTEGRIPRHPVFKAIRNYD